mgnify:CR=1 FL=1
MADNSLQFLQGEAVGGCGSHAPLPGLIADYVLSNRFTYSVSWCRLYGTPAVFMSQPGISFWLSLQ